MGFGRGGGGSGSRLWEGGGLEIPPLRQKNLLSANKPKRKKREGLRGILRIRPRGLGSFCCALSQSERRTGALLIAADQSESAQPQQGYKYKSFASQVQKASSRLSDRNSLDLSEPPGPQLHLGTGLDYLLIGTLSEEFSGSILELVDYFTDFNMTLEELVGPSRTDKK